MTNIDVAPAHVIRQYVWALLRSADFATWTEAKYGGLVPIVPLNEEPELDEFDGPRIVYEYTHRNTGTAHYRGLGNMTLAIRDNDFRRLGRTMNTLETALGRLDESARDLNDFIDRMKTDKNVVYGISFGYVEIGFSQSGTPEREEGGRMVGIVDLNFDYFVEYNSINTRPPVV